jgi:mycothiol synthase
LPIDGITINPFDPKTASDDDFARINQFRNTIRKERQPDDPPTSVAHEKSDLQNVPPVVEAAHWTSEDRSGRIVGTAQTGVINMETNMHIGQFDVRVLPEYRRQGLGTELLRLVTEFVKGKGRNLLLGSTRSTIPAGEEFMRAAGFEAGLAAHVNELQVSELNRAILPEWQERAAERASRFELGFWNGAYPEDELPEVSVMMQAMNTMPKGDLDIGDFKWTPEQIKEMDASLLASGNVRWTMYVREKSTGRIAGYTEMYWHPEKPTMALQDATGVMEQYKNKGLGRWLKAAMLEKLITERPQVTKVRTGNAQSNAPMLKINEELGFKPATTEIIWQAPVSTVEAYVRRA